MSEHVAIAIDGPAASGKSTLARALARRLGLVMVNSGEMYRAVTWKVLESGVDPGDAKAVIGALEAMALDCGVRDGHSTISVDGFEPGEVLRSGAVNAHVSKVAAVAEVRRRLVDLQRAYLRHSDVVMEGRDIGTVVFPDTPFKIYVDADESVRSQRRIDAGEEDAVGDRDRQDSSRKAAPLMVAEGAAVLDTSRHTIESGIEAALELLRSQGLKIEPKH